MNKCTRLSQDQLETLKLIHRSPITATGFRSCSTVVFFNVIRLMPKSLVKTKMDGECYFVKLTKEAETLLKWLA